MRLIEVSRGKYFAMVDDEDYDLVAQYKWYARKAPTGTVRHARTKSARPEQKTIYMHRMILGAQDGQYVDHIDHDGLNNVRSNLRFCTPAQNMANARFPKNSSGFRGVSRIRGHNRWRAKIKVGGRMMNLGSFRDVESAARAYDEAAKKYFGEFASCSMGETGPMTLAQRKGDA